MPCKQEVLEVYQAGPLTVLGFGGYEVLDHVDVTECRDEIAASVKENDCKVLAFDLTRVKLIPSGMLGLLASVRDMGVEVHVYNPSEDVREVLEITRLDTIINVNYVEVS